MEKRMVERLKMCSNSELRELIDGIVQAIENLEGMRSYLSITREKRRGKMGRVYRIYNFIDREELTFYKEKDANIQFLHILEEAGYYRPTSWSGS